MKMRYHTVQCSKSQCCKSYYVQNQYLKSKDTDSKDKKNSWGSFTATGSESTEREQTPCSTHLNRVYFYK